MAALVFARDQVRRVDELAVQKYGMCGLVLMENAGRNAAAIIDREFASRAVGATGSLGGPGGLGGPSSFGATGSLGATGGFPASDDDFSPRGRAVIFCGTGNNGGDGCVIARHLHNARWKVRLYVAGDETRMSPDMLANFRIAAAMDLEIICMADQSDRVSACDSITADEIVIDALLGTGFRGTVREDLAELIDGINRKVLELRQTSTVPPVDHRTAVVAIDVPSGLDCDTGHPGGIAIRADLTITFVASKIGFENPAAKAYTGPIQVADIGAPRELIEQIATGTM